MNVRLSRSLVACTTVLGLVMPSHAQKMEVAGGGGRQLLLLDAGDIAEEPQHLPRIAEFLRTFAAEKEADRASVQALGDRHLVALGTPVQVAAIERWVAQLRQRKEEVFSVDSCMCHVSAEFVVRELMPLTKVPERGIADQPIVVLLDAEAAATLTKAFAKDPAVVLLQSPRLSVRSMQWAHVTVGQEKAYIRDFEVRTVDGAVIADPVIATVRDGQEVNLVCASLAAKELAVHMEISSQTVAEPFKEVKTTVPGAAAEVTIQVPVVTGCRASQTLRIADGATAVMAARRTDGGWLVTMLTPRLVDRVETR